VLDERSDRRFHVFDRALVHLIVRGLIDRHRILLRPLESKACSEI
jgi:hypothetical protein